MKKILAAFSGIYFLLVAVVYADSPFIYKQGNNPATYVRLEKYKGSETLSHPHTISEATIADILRSLRYSRKALVGDKVKTRFIFEEEYIVKFAPYLVEAFQKANANETVIFSVAQKRPFVVMRNDRLTQIRMWIVGQELHMDFIKTEAQLLGDYQARNPGAKRLVEDSSSLRVELEPQEGQKFSASSIDELVIDLNADWQNIVTRIDDEDERVKAQEDTRKNRRKGSASSTPSSASTPASTPSYSSSKDQKSAETRLEELKRLKDKGLINDKDYNMKKDEILKGM